MCNAESRAQHLSPQTFAKNAANPAATPPSHATAAQLRALTVSLASANTGAATVPTSVVIPAGLTSATFHVTAVNDNIVEGARMVNIVASAAAYANVTNTVTVTDSSVPTLHSLSLAPI